LIREVISLILLSLALSFTALAWDDCPFGLVNDPEPGRCGLYQDTNSDSLCDHSQKKPSLLALAQDTAVPYGTGAGKVLDRPKVPTARSTPRPGKAAPAPAAPVTSQVNKPGMPGPDVAPRPPFRLRQRYPLWQVFLIVLVLAVATEFLTKRDKRLTLPLQTAWNWALGMSFLFTFASSLVYVYPALLVKINFNMSYWHSLAGLVMIAAGLYHFARRFGCMWRGLFSWFAAKDS
jgi:hypothetical protein